MREFSAAWPKLRDGGMVVADNILVPAKNAALIRVYLNHVGSMPDARTTTLNVGDGVELTVKYELSR